MMEDALRQHIISKRDQRASIRAENDILEQKLTSVINFNQTLQTKYKEEEEEPASIIEPPKMKRIGGGFVQPVNTNIQK